LERKKWGRSKMKYSVNFLGNTVVCLLLILIVGCASSPPSKFYLLSPISNESSTSQHSADEKCVSIAIGYVRLPEYTNRPQIVTRTSQNELSRSQFDLWAEPLQDTFSRVIAENLTRLLCTKRVYLPWMRSIKADYLVGVEVIEMNGDLGTIAFLQVEWIIWEGAEGRELVQRRSKYSEPVQDRSYSGLVQAYSNMIGQLSRDIAETIKEL
jgi:uncharacterized protein